MAALSIGVIYETTTLVIRRIVVPDHDWQLARHVCEGEDIAVLPKTAVPIGRFGPLDYRPIYEAIEKQTGRIPPTLEEVHRAQAQHACREA